MSGRAKSDVDELIEKTVAHANNLMAEADRLLRDSKQTDESLMATMEALHTTGKKLKDISKGILADKEFAVRKKNLNDLGDSLCEISGKLFLHISSKAFSSQSVKAR